MKCITNTYVPVLCVRGQRANKPSIILNPDLDVLQHTVKVNIILWSRRYGSTETDKNKKKQNSLSKQGNTWMNAHT